MESMAVKGTELVFPQESLVFTYGVVDVRYVVLMALVLSFLFGVICGGLLVLWCGGFQKYQYDLEGRRRMMSEEPPIKVSPLNDQAMRVPTAEVGVQVEMLVAQRGAFPVDLYVSQHGERWHIDPNCHGLRTALTVSHKTPCLICARQYAVR